MRITHIYTFPKNKCTKLMQNQRRYLHGIFSWSDFSATLQQVWNMLYFLCENFYLLVKIHIAELAEWNTLGWDDFYCTGAYFSCMYKDVIVKCFINLSSLRIDNEANKIFLSHITEEWQILKTIRTALLWTSLILCRIF